MKTSILSSVKTLSTFPDIIIIKKAVVRAAASGTSLKMFTVNSRYSGHPRDRDLVFVIAGCEKIFILNHIYCRGSHVCSFSLTPVPFSDPLSHVKTKTKTISKSRKKSLDMCAYIPRCCSVSATTRDKTIKL